MKMSPLTAVLKCPHYEKGYFGYWKGFFQKYQKKIRIVLQPYENTTDWLFLSAPLPR
jgi:hypothetical protein